MQHNFIPVDEVHIKIGGGHGGSSFKMPYQNVTQTSLITFDSHFHLEIASFQLNTSEVAKLENKIKHCEVKNVAINFTENIDEGSYATMNKLQVRNKEVAVKVLKKQFSKQKIMEVSIKLQKLNHPNVVRFRGRIQCPT